MDIADDDEAVVGSFAGEEGLVEGAELHHVEELWAHVLAEPAFAQSLSFLDGPIQCRGFIVPGPYPCMPITPDEDEQGEDDERGSLELGREAALYPDGRCEFPLII